MHPAVIYIKNEAKENVDVINTHLAFTPELNTTIYYKGVKATVTFVVVDVTPKIPAIVIHAQIK